MPGRGECAREGQRGWVFKDTRMPLSVVFQNLEAGATVAEIVAWFDVTPEQVKTVIEFAARSLEAPARGR